METLTKGERQSIDIFYEDVIKDFPNTKFRYNFLYRPNGISPKIPSTFLIHVLPSNMFYNNSKYMRMEYNFTRMFESKFHLALLFVSDDYMKTKK